MTAACFQALLLFSVNICSSCFSRNSILLTETVVLSIQMYAGLQRMYAVTAFLSNLRPLDLSTFSGKR